MLAPWQADVVARGELYRVGGAVRDRLLGLPGVEDTDYLVRGIPPAELEALLEQHGRLARVGKAFGVYRFTPSDGSPAVDIVYPRVETSTGPLHRDFDVHWDWSLPVEADLHRRDFTINAIAERIPDGARADPHDGAGDIDRRVLRSIFPAAFQEDPLRVLRGARFAARFDLRVDDATREQMRTAASAVATVSAERVQEEFSKTLLQCRRPSGAFALLHDLGALAVWLPELARSAGVVQNEYHPDDVFWHSLKSCDAAPRGRLLVRWAALLHDTGKVDTRQLIRDGKGERVVFYGHEIVSAAHTRSALGRLRYPVAFVEACEHLVREHMFRYETAWRPATVRRFMRRIGAEHLDDLFALREADSMSRTLRAEVEALNELRRRVQGELDARAVLRVTDLAVSGRDVMDALGLAAGPAVGRVLEHLLDHVLESPHENHRDRLLDVMRERYAAPGSG